MDRFLTTNFITSCIGHLQSIGSLSYADLQTLTHFTKKWEKKITFVNSPTISLEMSLGFGKLTSSCARHKSSQILIFTWKFKFYQWPQILLAAFLEVTGLLCSFWRKCLPNTEVWKPSFCVLAVHSSTNGIPWKKWQVQLAAQITTQVSFLETTITWTSVCSRWTLRVLFI